MVSIESGRARGVIASGDDPLARPLSICPLNMKNSGREVIEQYQDNYAKEQQRATAYKCFSHARFLTFDAGCEIAWNRTWRCYRYAWLVACNPLGRNLRNTYNWSHDNWLGFFH